MDTPRRYNLRIRRVPGPGRPIREGHLLVCRSTNGSMSSCLYQVRFGASQLKFAHLVPFLCFDGARYCRPELSFAKITTQPAVYAHITNQVSFLQVLCFGLSGRKQPDFPPLTKLSHHAGFEGRLLERV